MKKSVMLLLTLFVSINCLSNSQYDYYDDSAVAGGVEWAINVIIFIFFLIIGFVVVFVVIGFLLKVYSWINPKAGLNGKEKDSNRTKIKIIEDNQISANNDISAMVKNEDYPVSKIRSDSKEEGTHEEKQLISSFSPISLTCIFVLIGILLFSLIGLISQNNAYNELSKAQAIAKSEKDTLYSKLNRQQEEIETLKKEKELTEQYLEIASSMSLPITINDVRIHEPIPASIEYYYCVISYFSPKITNIPIDIKFYDSSGNLIKSTYSAHYSYSFNFKAEQGFNQNFHTITARDKEQLKEGKCKVEFWIYGNLAYSKEFQVYKESYPIDVIASGQ